MKSLKEHKEQEELEFQKSIIEEATGQQITVRTEKPVKSFKFLHIIVGMIVISCEIMFINIPIITYLLLLVYLVSGIWLLRK